MYPFELTYRSEIKALVGEAYEWGGVDAYTEIWDRLQIMKHAANKRGSGLTSGFFYAITQIEKLVDQHFGRTRTHDYRVEHTKIVRDRMRNADIAIDTMITGATKAGHLVPKRAS